MTSTNRRVIQSIHDIHERHVERKKQTHQIYRTLLRDVFKSIEQKDEQGKYNHIYRIPCVVYGNPKYNIATAATYIIRKLTQGGFVVYPYEGNMLYIDWSVVKVNMGSTSRLKPCLKKNVPMVTFNV